MQNEDTGRVLLLLTRQVERLDCEMRAMQAQMAALGEWAMRQREAGLVSVAGAEDFLEMERTKPRKKRPA